MINTYEKVKTGKIASLKKFSGFTLIELLVVIAIIAILATIVSINVVGAAKKSRDARRKSDITEVNKAVGLYRLDKGVYPPRDNCPSALINDYCLTTNEIIQGENTCGAAGSGVKGVWDGDEWVYENADGTVNLDGECVIGQDQLKTALRLYLGSNIPVDPLNRNTSSYSVEDGVTVWTGDRWVYTYLAWPNPDDGGTEPYFRNYVLRTRLETREGGNYAEGCFGFIGGSDESASWDWGNTSDDESSWVFGACNF